MHNFTRNLITEWRKLNLPVSDATVVVAVSGGADSVSLMLALSELRERRKLTLRFVAAHFNHNLRGAASDADENFVRKLTEKFNFELVCKTPNPEFEIKNRNGNLEQNARTARYDFLFETAANLDAYAILTAHTLNDQAETFLLNLIRGSGLDGLGAMKPVTNRVRNEQSQIRNPEPEIFLIRPLLRWARRKDTEDFCLLNKIEYRYDAMNEDLKFNRVRVRKVLLPMLEDFNPKIIETLARTSELLRDGAEQLAEKKRKSEEQETENNQPQAASEKQEAAQIAVKDLRDVFPSMRKIVLRDWLKENRGNLRRIEMKHIEAVERLVFSRKSGRIVELPNGETIVKEKGKLHFKKSKVEK